MCGGGELLPEANKLSSEVIKHFKEQGAISKSTGFCSKYSKGRGQPHSVIIGYPELPKVKIKEYYFKWDGSWDGTILYSNTKFD